MTGVYKTGENRRKQLVSSSLAGTVGNWTGRTVALSELQFTVEAASGPVNAVFKVEASNDGNPIDLGSITVSGTGTVATDSDSIERAFAMIRVTVVSVSAGATATATINEFDEQ